MEFDRSTGKITASKGDWHFLERVALLKSQAALPGAALWQQMDDEFLWRKIVSQICNRGGVGWSAALRKNGLRDAFDASVSAAKLRTFSGTVLKRYVLNQMAVFHVGRFREDNAKAVIANVLSFVDASGHLSELRKRLDELDCTGEPLGSNMQAKERAARTFMMQRLMLSQGQENPRQTETGQRLLNQRWLRTDADSF